MASEEDVKSESESDDDSIGSSDSESDTRRRISTNLQDGISVSVSPQQSHIFGGQHIVLTFGTDTPLDDELYYYIVFDGNKLRHITSTKLLNPYTIEAVIPDHDEAELVKLLICKQYRETDARNEELQVVSRDTFVFTSDSSQFLAKELFSNALSASALLHLQEIYSSLFMISYEEKKELDEKLTTSFMYLKKTSLNWRLTEKEDLETPSWTLLHFCAKYNLPKLAEYLLRQSGAMNALKYTDKHGRTPCAIAIKRKNRKMIEILSRIPCEEDHQKFYQDITRPSVKRHKLGTTTVTNQTSKNDEDIVKDLMLLKELDALATTSKEIPLQNGGSANYEESSPLAASLKKLQEINDEIRRLRSLSYKETLEQYESEMDYEHLELDLKDAVIIDGDDVLMASPHQEKVEENSGFHTSISSDNSNIENSEHISETSSSDMNKTKTNTFPNVNENIRTVNSECDIEIMPVNYIINDTVSLSIDESSITNVEHTISVSNLDTDVANKVTKLIPSNEILENNLPQVVIEEVLSGDCSHRSLSNIENSVLNNKLSYGVDRKVIGVSSSINADTPHVNVASIDGKTISTGQEVGDNSLSSEILTIQNIEDIEQTLTQNSPDENSKYKQLSCIVDENSNCEILENNTELNNALKIQIESSNSDDPVENTNEYQNVKCKESEIINVKENLYEASAKDDDDVKCKPVTIIADDLTESCNPDNDIAPEKIEIREEKENSEQSKNSDIESSCSSTELNRIQLESVTEETEEELKAVSSPGARSQKNDGLVYVTQTKSMSELPKHSNKRVSILRQTVTKKDRPLSDSFENLQMVEKQGMIGLYHACDTNNLSDEGRLVRGHSLDTLTNIEDQDQEHQLDIADHQYSQESISSESESGKSVTRSDSGKFSISSYNRASSLVSLNDVSRCSSTSSQEELDRWSTKRSSLLTRLNRNKKAKSMTSLDFKNINIEEDRRRVISAHLEPGYLPTHDRKQNHKTLIQCDPYENNKLKKSISSSAVDKMGNEPKKLLDHTLDDTPVKDVMVDKNTVMRKKSSEKRNKSERHKTMFNILRSKPKDKNVTKEKSKDDYLMNSKDSDSKPKKQGKVPNKTEVNQHDFKSSFLAKRGTSFRQNLRSSSDSKSTEKFSKNESSNRLKPDKKSPVMNRKISTSIPENGDFVNDDSQLFTLNKNLSLSRTSLDSLSLTLDDKTDGNDYLDDENYDPLSSGWDSDLDSKDEPETWSELVDKKVQRKMHAKDIKRQDVIYELIQTEAFYVRNLYIMRKIYANGMLTLGMEPASIKIMFPLIDDLIELNGGFIKAMKTRQEESQNFCIEDIGDILVDFFGGEQGETIKYVYGYFCSHHLEAVALYKELLKSDRQFAAFMRKCLANDRVRRLSVPECITYVTIRMTKYPLLIEAIIKATKENKPDYEKLKKSLILVKEVLHAVDDAVEAYEQEKELKLLKKSLDRKFVVEIKSVDPSGTTKTAYKASQLFNKKSRLLLDKKTTLRGKHKLYDARMTILATKIVFFQENNNKLQLLSVDNKAPVLSLKNVLVKEVATDSKALFLVSTSKDAAHIYEIGCDSSKDKKELHLKLTKYIKNCPDEESDSSDEEEALREEEERVKKLKEVLDQLQLADDKVSQALNEKNRLVLEMRELIEAMDDCGIVKGSSCHELKPGDIANARETLETCLTEVNNLSTSFGLQSSEQASPLPSPALASNQSLNNPVSSSKRNESFSTFEQRMKPSYSASNVSRTVSINNRTIRPSTAYESTDISKPRRQSQFMSVLGRTRTMGSTEDLTSISSSVSSASLSTMGNNMQSFQYLKESLTSLVDVTNKQDVEIGKMRLELQENRTETIKLRNERKELEEKLAVSQKESEKQSKNDKEQYSKLKREFRRTVDQYKSQLDEKKTQFNQLLSVYNEQNHIKNNSSSSSSGKKRQEEVILI